MAGGRSRIVNKNPGVHEMKKELITPKKAMLWLQRNVANRPLSQSRVSNYAKAITDGKWKVNGDCIRFNGNGDLIDGQHRLAAIVKSETPIESYVLRGLDHDAFDTIDQGKARSISDVLARSGHKHYTTLGSSLRWLWSYENGFPDKSVAFRPDMANDMLQKNPGIHEAVEAACSLRIGRQLIPGGVLGFLIYECGKKNKQSSVEFWQQAVGGEELKKGSAGFMLHQRLMKNATSSIGRLRLMVLVALSIKAWNAHRTGKPPGILKYDPSVEEFPRIVH